LVGLNFFSSFKKDPKNNKKIETDKKVNGNILQVKEFMAKNEIINNGPKYFDELKI
jgi:hypothetical protein